MKKSKVQNTVCYLSHKNGEKLQCILMFAYISTKTLQKDTQKSNNSGLFLWLKLEHGETRQGLMVERRVSLVFILCYFIL